MLLLFGSKLLSLYFLNYGNSIWHWQHIIRLSYNKPKYFSAIPIRMCISTLNRSLQADKNGLPKRGSTLTKACYSVQELSLNMKRGEAKSRYYTLWLKWLTKYVLNQLYINMIVSLLLTWISNSWL